MFNFHRPLKFFHQVCAIENPVRNFVLVSFAEIIAVAAVRDSPKRVSFLGKVVEEMVRTVKME
jgi:hypothetical protein